MTSIELQLEKFREAYPSVKCLVGSDDIVYRVGNGKCEEAAAKANLLIERLGLDLVAIPAKGFRANSFFVKSNLTDGL